MLDRLVEIVLPVIDLDHRDELADYFVPLDHTRILLAKPSTARRATLVPSPGAYCSGASAAAAIEPLEWRRARRPGTCPARVRHVPSPGGRVRPDPCGNRRPSRRGDWNDPCLGGRVAVFHEVIMESRGAPSDVHYHVTVHPDRHELTVRMRLTGPV